ncbi:MAG: hypothetical protein JSU89_14165, partial [Myxococcales bacterium]
MEHTLSDEKLEDFENIDPDELPEQSIQYAEVEVTSAEILALNSTPKTLVPAPGAGKVLEFISAILILDYESAA